MRAAYFHRPSRGPSERDTSLALTGSANRPMMVSLVGLAARKGTKGSLPSSVLDPPCKCTRLPARSVAVTSRVPEDKVRAGTVCPSTAGQCHRRASYLRKARSREDIYCRTGSIQTGVHQRADASNIARGAGTGTEESLRVLYSTIIFLRGRDTSLSGWHSIYTLPSREPMDRIRRYRLGTRSPDVEPYIRRRSQRGARLHR